MNQRLLPVRSHWFAGHPRPWALLAICAAAVLSACGGGSVDPATSEASFSLEIAAGAGTADDDTSPLPESVASLLAEPAFHAAPLLLTEPGDTDASNPAASAQSGPRVQALEAGSEATSTRGLTVQALESGRRAQALAATGRSGDGGVAAPMVSTSVISTYNPAQIRAAYGLPALPAAGAKLTANQAAQQGAGQTLYIVDAMHDPNLAAELAAFNLKFGLPGCTTKAIAANTTLPLAAASTSAGCELAVVYSTTNNGMTNAAPAYNAGWATEITLDVQWAHATAPLARIVLIEAPDASITSLSAAIKLANAMGPGVVSMSFGANEGNWTASTESAFAGSNMTYLAATGDSGAAVSWPAVSPKVLAVGGTRLSYSGSGLRSEQGWARTGGGISQYTATPGYQANTVPGVGNLARRAVADVAFNADPATGQYVAVMTPGSAAVSWLSVGGTSLSTPQWAGLIAVANAQRVLAAKAMLGVPHALLYGGIASVPGSYASAFADITQGSNGSCSTCTAKTGYDPLTGLGTPNAANLLAALTAASSTTTPTTTSVAGAPPTPLKTGPVITAAAMTGVQGQTMTGSIGVSNTDNLAMSVTISGVPTGMRFTLSGSTLTARWASPAIGNYSLSLRALDSAGHSSAATVPVTVSAK